MATISSHILNAVDGSHAGGVRLECFRLADDGRAEEVFSVASSDGGRVQEAVDVDGNDPERVYELVFHIGEYFDCRGLTGPATVVPAIVFRLRMPDPDGRYHMPVIIAPHGYSTWWSTPAG